MYERFYNLRERPFSLSPDPDYLYPSRVHKEALNYLRYGIEGHAAFVVITGEIGSGKTTLLQTVLRGLDRQTAVARLVNTMLDARELIEAVMIDFGLNPQTTQSKPQLLRDLARFLVEQRSAGRLALLVIDEAQNLTLPALEEIRMLSNLETEKSKLIQIVLVGQPNLRDVLNRPELEQLKQRVTVSYHLQALDTDETSAYVNHRLKRAAIGVPMEFSRPVTDLIHVHSQGVPRKINVIADAVLLFGYGEDQKTITPALVDDVIKDLQETGVLGERQAAPAPNPAPVPTPAADRDRDLALREARLAQRERELLEQQRVLSEEYRLLRARQEPSTPTAPWQSSVDSRQSSVVGRQSAVDGRQSAVDGRQSAVDGRQSAVESRQSSVESRQSPVVSKPAAPEAAVATAPRQSSGTAPVVTPQAGSAAAPLDPDIAALRPMAVPGARRAADPAPRPAAARPAAVRPPVYAPPSSTPAGGYRAPVFAIEETGGFWSRLRRQLSGFAKQVLQD